MNSPLTDAKLADLLAAVPLPYQQRDQLVRVNLRPGLPDNYTGPVELSDLRLQLSPWHWLRAELAETPYSAALAAEWDGPWSVEEMGWWLGEKASGADDWLFPSDPEYWGGSGTLGTLAEGGTATFVSPDLCVTDITAFFGSASPHGEVIVLLAVGWGESAADSMGPTHLLGSTSSTASDGDGTMCLESAGSLWLLDPNGEHTQLEADGLPDEELEEAEDNPDAWRGECPRFVADAPSNTDEGIAPAWLEAGLGYADHRLYRADTGQELTLRLHPGVASE